MIVAVYTVLSSLLTTHRTLGVIAVNAVTGAAYVLVMLPLIRRLPYRWRVRFLAVFAPLYWIALLSNFIEAAFYPSMPHDQLVKAAVVFGILAAIVSALIAWLLRPPAHEHPPAPAIRELLGAQPPQSCSGASCSSRAMRGAR